jgi:leader peptidase (prepilin peptidase)/N-methyltransferase
MSILIYLQSNPTAFILAMGLMGLIVGSFLNVIIHRLPKIMEADWRSQCAELMGTEDPSPPSSGTYSLAYPASHCPHCQHPIRAYDNIPLLGYLWLKGKCRNCRHPIPVRYPLVEFLTAAFTMMVVWRFGFGAEALFGSILTWALIALSFIDLDTQYLPDAITLPFLWLGLGCNLFGLFAPLESSVIGAMAGYLCLWVVYQGFKLTTGKEGMGYGDFKLAALFGAWLGWEMLPAVIILASLTGSILGLSLMLYHRRDKNIPIPFGPYLSIAGWGTLLWGHEITALYTGWIAGS